MEYKNVKVPVWAYDNALAARGDLLRRGLNSLPEEVREPQQCPRCGSSMEPLANAPGVECSSGCGYRQERIESGGVALGVLLGLGVTALLESIGTPSAGVVIGRARNTQAAKEAILRIQHDAVRRGLDKITNEEIDAEIRAVRQARRRKK
jgi:hypothetical protein